MSKYPHYVKNLAYIQRNPLHLQILNNTTLQKCCTSFISLLICKRNHIETKPRPNSPASFQNTRKVQQLRTRSAERMRWLYSFRISMSFIQREEDHKHCHKFVVICENFLRSYCLLELMSIRRRYLFDTCFIAGS